MTSPQKHNDTKLLMAVAGTVVLFAAGIVFFAGRFADREASTAKPPARSVAGGSPMTRNGPVLRRRERAGTPPRRRDGRRLG